MLHRPARSQDTRRQLPSVLESIDVSIGNEVDDLLTMERSTMDLNDVFVAVETEPSPPTDYSLRRRAIVKFEAKAIKLVGEGEGSFTFEIDREALPTLAVAFLHVAKRVEKCHSPAV